ncbi:MAG: 6-phosphofructokinase, partial [Clostridia bacterium]|nr:6-phosphofructokinase [Clostridia bacterium]
VMGRHCGDIAFHVGVAVGATYILVPEIEFTFEEIIKKINKGQASGKKHFIIVVAEGVGGSFELAQKIEETTGIETRATILGHVQRGGNASVRDRVLASQMGVAAVELLKKGIGNRVIASRDNKIVDFDIYEALQMKQEFDKHLYDVALEIGI